ncbi:MAG: bifunctional diaminohydroxyphosphoribosylaminopyrimidine deaminase/5-amino-6-(5-phosphoribosylamino)uracil reductase RibD [Dehalococcoidia bacterium]|nr:bifunctional diaminohydroxyphosphoribosylaminopyrimidine deaminase/5-amino-6-(5-phosphoribosylamino)uracil reductase RibD [Dehalococcoidia bacterium]
MARALELARSALGTTSPNPSVGAVIVRAGRIVGEGATRPAGQEHAEVVALKQAGEAARGATLYVNLEPCSHQGRTGPCTQAIINAGIAEVRFALADPNPLVDGKGRRQLEAAGIRVVAGEQQEEAAAVNEGFCKWITTRLPFVTAKAAVSLDGKLATRTGDSRWISGEAARAWAHRLRAASDAVLVGVGTVLADDPQLNARPAGEAAARQPLRVVVDSHGRTPPGARLWQEKGAVLIAAAGPLDPARRQALTAAGAQVWEGTSGPDGRVDLAALCRELGRREVTSVLVEGGSTLLGSFFDLLLVDKLHAVIAPLILGGLQAPTMVGGRGVGRIAEALRLHRMRAEALGDDILITGYPKG